MGGVAGEVDEDPLDPAVHASSVNMHQAHGVGGGAAGTAVYCTISVAAAKVRAVRVWLTASMAARLPPLTGT